MPKLAGKLPINYNEQKKQKARPILTFCCVYVKNYHQNKKKEAIFPSKIHKSSIKQHTTIRKAVVRYDDKDCQKW
ncbi:hypothetical protein [Moraxella nasicaprae]|uniref:Uncharacterized protein n=1 Tax=Moraxella nasicaprae TaxID=2904122 RepID=A0ABY6F5N3_9GAMM|nr:hypothetical protein [Moraxella nasicaprae]UXZ05267.1 hypothetical protein LU297_02095 [Moraxella nasicaprae]